MVLGIAAANAFTTKAIITSPKFFGETLIRLKIHFYGWHHMTNNLKFESGVRNI